MSFKIMKNYYRATQVKTESESSFKIAEQIDTELTGAWPFLH